MNSKLKKVLIGIGGFVGILLLAAIAIPFFIDVDKYRPQIVQAANERINGKLELGKLSLSLWGQIRVQVAGVKLVDAASKPVINVSDAYFHVPFSSILGGSPLLTFKMQKPEVVVTKNKAGKLNVMGLMKDKPAGAQPSQGTGAPAGTPAGAQGGGGGSTLPAIATQARLGVSIDNAHFTYKDELTGVATEIKDLNIVVRDLSLSRPTEIEIWANMDTEVPGKTADDMTRVKGPVRLTARSELMGGKLDELQMKAKLNMDDLEIRVGKLFHKTKGMAANVDGEFQTTPREAKIQKLDIKFFNAEVSSKGQIALGGESPVVDFSAQSNEIALKPWSELIPMLKEYELGGLMKLSVAANGPSAQLGYKADFSIQQLTAKAPNLKSQPQFDVAVKVVTDQIESMSATMKAPGNDLKISGKLVSFTKPNLTLQVSSNGMDLDQLIEFPKTAATPPGTPSAPAASGGGKAGAPAAAKGGDSKSAAAPAEDLDALLDPLRNNPMASAAIANIGFNLAFIKAQNMRFSELQGRMSFKDLVATIDSVSMKLWNGSIKMDGSVAMKPKAPSYRFNSEVARLDLSQAISTNLDMIKNTVSGIANFKIAGSGVSFNPDPAKRNLNAKGNAKIDNAVFTTIDVAKMAGEAINGSIDKIAGKVPALKGKTVKVPNKKSTYETISTDFTIAGGQFSMPNFVAKAKPQDGVDLRGSTQLGMIDYSLKADWEVIDTYDFLKARELSVNVAGTEVPHILAEGNNPIKFPISVGGTVFQPQYSYTQVPEYLASVALKNATGAATSRAKQEVQKKVQEQIQQKAPAQVQDALKKLKLFGR